MAAYQLINLRTGEFHSVGLDEAAQLACLDPSDIAWAIEERGVCETETFQITKLNDPPEDGDACDAGDADSHIALPVFVFISQEEFEAHLAEPPASVIHLKWDEPIVREAVEANRDKVAAMLRSGAAEPADPQEPSAVYRLTRESIALIR